jgi:site-specific DNA-methyltransferase (adenine-specific)
MTLYHNDKSTEIHNGDCVQVLRTLPDSSVDACVTDPPYGLAFMGKKWDYDVPSVEVWQECLRVLKPGGHLLAFAGTRTQHRMAVRIEDAGFEIRDMIAWVYGSGFPKSLDVSKAIDKRGGSQVAWFGPWFRKWREEHGITQKQVAALFPSKTGGLTGCVANWELGINMPTPEQFNLIRDTFKLPFASVAEAEREVVGRSENGIAGGSGKHAGEDAAYGFGAEFNITAPATEAAKQWQGWGTALKPALEPITVARKPFTGTVAENVLQHGTGALNVDGCRVGDESGRFPANLIHDGSEEVVGLFPETAPAKMSDRGKGKGDTGTYGVYGGDPGVRGHDDAGGSAARFFYCAKADASERRNSKHPTIKPVALMRYLVRLVCPPGGVVLDPFAGSGTTIEAARLEHCRAIGIEREAEYCADILERLRQGVLF